MSSSVDSLQHAALDELAQVSAYGLGSDAEVVGEGRDLDPTVVPRALQDLSLPLVSFHRAASWVPSTWGSCRI
jgi:hypothetical protein